MIQMILPSLLFGSTPSTVTLRGGTSVSKSPSVRYFEKILFPLLKNFGIEASVKINEEGYYPWGGGEAQIKVQPVNFFFECLKI